MALGDGMIQRDIYLMNAALLFAKAEAEKIPRSRRILKTWRAPTCAWPIKPSAMHTTMLSSELRLHRRIAINHRRDE